MSTLLNISALSRRTGVAPDTLRKWEQRYGVLRPLRTPGGQRRYSETDVARVEWLRDRLAEGWRISEAARVLQESAGPGLDDPGELREAILAAVESNAVAEVTALLDQTFAVLPLEQAFDQVLAPVLRAVGDAWHEGRISIAQEHALSAKVRARLDELVADPRGAVRGTAVLACGPGEQHDLGLLMLAVLLRADGWRVEYLGQNTPVSEALAFAQDVGARVLCVGASRPDTIAAIEREGRRNGSREPVLLLGGPAVTPAIARKLGVGYAGRDLDASVKTVGKYAA